jgi:hypothetical protein
MQAGADVLGRWEHLLHGLDVGLVVIAHHLRGAPAGAYQRLAEEGGGGLEVSVRSKEDIDDLPRLIHRPIEVVRVLAAEEEHLVHVALGT